MSHANIGFNVYPKNSGKYKKLSYRRETARQLPT